MKYAMLSAVAVAGLLLADTAANAQVVVGGGVGVRVGGVGIGVGVAPAPVVVAPPTYVVPAPGPVVASPGVIVAQPAPVLVAPAPVVSVGVGFPVWVGGGWRYGPGYYGRYYRR